MTWKIVKRKLGRAGGEKQREARQREWDRTYGEGLWEIGYVVDGTFLPQQEALDCIYYQSYAEHFEKHPEDLAELIQTAKALRNPHAVATSGVDLQTPSIYRYLEARELNLSGTAIVEIGSWQGQASHPVSIRLSPLQIACCIDPRLTLESFWQQKKCLAVWEDKIQENVTGN